MARNTTLRKQTQTYYFSVEGETEQWYLKWLENQINENENATYRVKFFTKVQKDPVSFVKSLVVQKEPTIWHLSDIEGNSAEQVQAVHNTLGRLKAVKSLGKSVIYKWGYSNLSFDLWIVLHKQSCNAELNSVDGYLSRINGAFGTQFESLKKYKEEANFKRCLLQLCIDDVITAVGEAKKIMQRNELVGYPLTHFKGYSYYAHNPSLDLWQPIEIILSDCGLL